MPRKEHSPETRAAVMAALMEGQSLTQVAKEYKLPKTTVSNWKREAAAATQVPNEKRARITELLTGYLEDNLAALRAQAKVMGDPEWVRKQDANEVAVMHGIMTDKAVRLLEAMAGAQER